MVHFCTLLLLSLLLPLALLLFYTLCICSINICTYVLAMLLPGVLAITWCPQGDMVVTLSRGGFQGDIAVTLARGALQGHEEYFLPI